MLSVALPAGRPDIAQTVLMPISPAMRMVSFRQAPWAAVGRVQRVAVGIQRDDLETAILERAHEVAARIRAFSHGREIEMGRGRPAAGVDLDAGHTHACGIVEQLVESHAAQTVGDETEFHAFVSFFR